MIGVCTLAIGKDYKEVVKYGIQNKKEYCEHHGYGYHDDEDVYDATRHPAWSKVLLLLKYITKYDYLMWIDADTYIMNDTITIEHLISKVLPESFDMVLANIAGGVNTGVIIMRCTEWVRNFWETVWKQKQFISHPNWEQQAVRHLAKINYNESQKHINFLYENKNPSSVMLQTPIRLYRDGMFILHFVGCNGKKLDYLMNDVFCTVRKENESDKSFRRRIINYVRLGTYGGNLAVKLGLFKY